MKIKSIFILIFIVNISFATEKSHEKITNNNKEFVEDFYELSGMILFEKNSFSMKTSNQTFYHTDKDFFSVGLQLKLNIYDKIDANWLVGGGVELYGGGNGLLCEGCSDSSPSGNYGSFLVLFLGFQSKYFFNKNIYFNFGIGPIYASASFTDYDTINPKTNDYAEYHKEEFGVGGKIGLGIKLRKFIMGADLFIFKTSNLIGVSFLPHVGVFF